MRFFRVKKEQDCFYCNATLDKGDEGVITTINRKNGTFDLKIGHVECFRQWSDEEFVRRYLRWKEELDPPVKKRKYHHKKITGRPRIYKHPIMANRIRGLIHYHTRKGNTEKVAELQAVMDSLRKEASNGGSIPVPAL